MDSWYGDLYESCCRNWEYQYFYFSKKYTIICHHGVFLRFLLLSLPFSGDNYFAIWMRWPVIPCSWHHARNIPAQVPFVHISMQNSLKKTSLSRQSEAAGSCRDRVVSLEMTRLITRLWLQFGISWQAMISKPFVRLTSHAPISLQEWSRRTGHDKVLEHPLAIEFMACICFRAQSHHGTYDNLHVMWRRKIRWWGALIMLHAIFTININYLTLQWYITGLFDKLNLPGVTFK